MNYFYKLRYISWLILAGLITLTACKEQGSSEKEIEKQSFDYSQLPVWQNPDKPIDDRLADIIGRLTLEEKVAQLTHGAPAIERLGIPEYNWWNECLHGVARSGRATVFPQAIAMGATFDEDLLFRIASAISDEARAKYNVAQSIGNRTQYAGLTFWTPNINIFRDPRWGRGQETYGEDPYLTARLGVNFVKGLQGDHPKYLKAAACAKHYAVHSGPEGLRHEFNAIAPRRDFYETYLPAFEALVKEAKVEAVMCAYNRTYDEACCGSPFLLKKILRDQWGFQGHIVSDCGALNDFHTTHKLTESPEESAALALKSGVNLNCGGVYAHLLAAIDKGLITEADIDTALTTLWRTRMKLGLFDPPNTVPFDTIGEEVINCEKHRQLAREAAAKSIVMLKNDDVLPLSKDIRSLYILGPYAADGNILLGNYYGVTGNMVNILEGITAKVSAGTTVEYKYAFLPDRENINPIDWTTGESHSNDAIIVTLGISGLLEGEEGESIASPHKGDRPDIGLPENQINYLKKLRNQGDKPIIAVLVGGSPMAIEQVHELADAVLMIWYPGEQGGNALADILFGDVSPSGRLPITFPRSADQLPPYDDYGFFGRTYRYMEAEPLYPFGFGLTYSEFSYSDLQLDKKTIADNESIQVSLKVSNIGKAEAEEVVQLYITDLEASQPTARYSLKQFKRIKLKAGESQKVEFTISPEMLSLITDEGDSLIEPGEFLVTVGGASPGPRSQALGAAKPAEARFTVK